ncbi:MAG TPA: hypothetical protein VIU61_17775 [Kofleriaceae bacterium]
MDKTIRRRARGEIAAGVALVAGAVAYSMLGVDDTAGMSAYLIVFGLALGGLAAIAIGAWRTGPRSEPPAKSDPRRWIYGGLALAFGLVYVLCLVFVMPNRLPSAAMHLWTIPIFTFVMAIGTIAGGRVGWWFGVLGGSAVLATTIFAIVRILASAAFLAGVYGAFGKAASTFAFVAVALMVEVVALLPICQVRWLMSRSGRHTYGVAR